jgi:hypothetical protein
MCQLSTLIHEDEGVPEMIRPYALTVDDAVKTYGIGRTRLYGLLASGDVIAVKDGRKTLVLAESIKGYIDSLPRATITTGQTTKPAGPAAATGAGQPPVVGQIKAPPVATPRSRGRAKIETTAPSRAAHLEAPTS